MKSLDNATISDSREAAAGSVIDTAFLVVRLVRAEIRRSRPARLSLQQVQALAVVGKSAGASVSRVAEQLGLALPSASHLVDGLVRRGLLARRSDAADRRRVRLDLTARGTAALRRATELGRAVVANRLSGLSPAERRAIADAMGLLRAHLASGSPSPE